MFVAEASFIVAAIIVTYAKNPLTDKDYVHDIKLDSNRRFATVNAFKTFIQKYDPVSVFENIEQLSKDRGRNFNVTEQVDLVLKGIDPTDDLLRLKVQNGNPKVLALSSSRRHFRQTWTPPPGLTVYQKDQFSYKPRLYELMKQAIYQARNKMILMQIMRGKYNEIAMFKMGFLMSKTDNACKVFNKVAFHAYRTCHRLLNSPATQMRYMRFGMYELQVTHTRAIHLWFQAELLSDLVILNDIAFHEAYEAKRRWNFTD